MAQVNPLTREVLIKLVYYGPGLGGKTTTLQQVHGASPTETRGKIVSLATPVDRTLYFDFMPLRVGSVQGYPVRLQLFTVPGQVYFNATRKLVLTGADGVVFVADSQRERQDANLESLQNLNANLEEQKRELADIPHIFQYNKQDLPNVVPTETINEALNSYGMPYFESVASKGEGVLEPLDELVRLVLDDLKARDVFGKAEPPELARQPSFGPAGDGMDSSLTRVSQELWESDHAAGASSVAAAELPPQSPEEEARAEVAASVAPTAEADLAALEIPSSLDAVAGAAALSTATQADLAPVELGAPLASEPPPHQVTPPPPDPSNETPLTPTVVAPSPMSAGPGSLNAPTFGPASSAAAHTKPGGLSWASLFADEQRPGIVDLENELSEGQLAAAVLRCDSIASELLADVAEFSGLAPEDRRPSIVAQSLGLAGERWLLFRHLVSRAKSGEALPPTDALEAYATLLEINRLRFRLR